MSETSTVIRPPSPIHSAHPARAADSISLSTINYPQTSDTHSILDAEAPPDAVEAIPDGGYGWTVVFACAFLLFWMNGYATAWGVLQTAIATSPQLHMNVRTITFVGSLYMACMVAFGLLSVRVTAALGVRNACLISSIMFGSGLILTSVTLDNIGGMFAVTGVLIGVGTSLLFTMTNSLPLQWFSSKLGLATGLVKAGGGLGATVLPLLAQELIDKVGLAWTFRILGFLVLTTGISCSLLLKERIPAGQVARFDWSQLKSAPFLALATAGAVGVFALYVPPFFLPLFARSIGLSTSTGAGLVAGFGASTAIGRLVGGLACDRIGAFNTLALSAFVNAFTMLAIWPVSESLPPLFVFAIVNGGANGAYFVALPTAVASLAPASAATSISLMVSFWTPGYLLGPPLAAILIEATGAAESSSIGPYRAAIFYAAGVGSLSLILIILSRMKLDTKLLKKL